MIKSKRGSDSDAIARVAAQNIQLVYSEPERDVAWGPILIGLLALFLMYGVFR